MNKKIMERFISKYNLSGNCERVIYKSSKGVLTTRGLSEDKDVIVEIIATDAGLPDGEFAIKDTQKLKSLLNVLGDNIKSSVNLHNNSPVSLLLSDKNTKVTYVLADPSIIKSPPEFKTHPAYEISINIDEEFITTFIRAKTALNEVEQVTFKSDGTGTTDVILGHSKLNINNVSISLASNNHKLDSINFSAKYLREALVANKDAKSGRIEVSSKGFCKVYFNYDGIESTYYLLELSEQ